MNNQSSFPGFFSGHTAIKFTVTGSFTSVNQHGLLEIRLFEVMKNQHALVQFERVEMACELLNFLNVPINYE